VNARQRRKVRRRIQAMLKGLMPCGACRGRGHIHDATCFKCRGTGQSDGPLKWSTVLAALAGERAGVRAKRRELNMRNMRNKR
jgi:DnaJ-class molecular chaperone